MPHPQVAQPKACASTHRPLSCARLVYASVSSSPGAMLTMHRTTMRPLARNMYLRCRPMSHRAKQNECAALTPSGHRREYKNEFSKASMRSVPAVSIAMPCNGRTNECSHDEPGQVKAYTQFGRQLLLKRAAS